MNEKLSILITEYNIDNVFFIVKKDNKNLYVDMGICQFVEEMEYWDMPLKCGMVNGEAGFIVSKEIDIEDVKMEIERLYEDIKGVEGLNAHHVGQKAIMKDLVTNYDYLKALAINVPIGFPRYIMA